MLSIIGRWPHSTEKIFHALILSQISINVNCVKQTRLFQLQFYDGWIKALFFVGARVSVCVCVCATVCMYVSLWIFTRPFDILFFLCHLTIEQCSFLPLMTQRHITWELIAVLLVFIEPFHNIFMYTRILARARLVLSLSLSLFSSFPFSPFWCLYSNGTVAIAK